MYALAIILHVLSAVLWIGGLFFSYMVLRPSALSLQPPERLRLWAAVFKKFFPWVWLAIVLLLLTGYYMLFGVFGGFKNTAPYIHTMNLLGWIMMALFIYLYFRLYLPFKAAVASESWPVAAKLLNRIRHVVLINLLIGVSLLIVVYVTPRL